MSDVHHSLNSQCCLLLKTSISNSDSLLFYTRLLMYAIPFCLDRCCTCQPYVDLRLLDCVLHHNWHGPTAFFNKPFRLRLCLCLSLCLPVCLCLSPSQYTMGVGALLAWIPVPGVCLLSLKRTHKLCLNAHTQCLNFRPAGRESAFHRTIHLQGQGAFHLSGRQSSVLPLWRHALFTPGRKTYRQKGFSSVSYTVNSG